jgi:uncharacterized protein YjbI with pentapeptide repeats
MWQPARRSLIALVCLLATVRGATRPAAAAGREGPRPLLDERTFQELIKGSQPVRNVTVPAFFLTRLFTLEDGAQLRGVDEINLIGCTIDGPLDLSHRNVRVALSFMDVTFAGNVVFAGTRFLDEVAFLGASRFQARLNISRAVFESSLTISPQTRLERMLYADGASFRGRSEIQAQMAGESVLFRGASFQNAVAFDRARFGVPVVFSEVGFARAASFQRTHIPAGGSVEFDHVDFAGATSFSGLHIEGALRFRQATFAQSVSFEELNGGSQEPVGHITFRGAQFKGRVYFDDSRLFEVDLSARSEDAGGEAAPSVFEKSASFQAIRWTRADFGEVEFGALADFYGAGFGAFVRLDRAVFGGEVDFRRVVFPAPDAVPSHAGDSRGLSLDRVRFQKSVNLDFDQLEEPAAWWCLCAGRPRVVTKDASTWRSLEDGFARAGDLRGANGAMYERRLVESRTAGLAGRVRATLEWAVWGFGVWPSRVALWTAGLVLAFAALYRTQIGEADVGRRSAFWGRWRAAIEFSLRTSLALDYGRRHSRTRGFKVITALQSLLTKTLLVLFGKALLNVSPLLKDIVHSLVGL